MRISAEEIENIKREYNEFRKTPSYEERKNQLVFSDFAREVITKLLQKELITNENLTALIQIFGNRSSSENVKKYIDSLNFEKSISEEIFYKFIELGQTGFTGRGKAIISGLTNEQLNLVREFLVNVAKIDVAKNDSEMEIRKLVLDFANKDIPHIKSGVYSPWLYYLHPTVCPILAGPVKSYLRKIGWDSKTYLDAWDIMKQINQTIGETNYGFVDQFVCKMSEGRSTETSESDENEEVEKKQPPKEIDENWKNNEHYTRMKKLLSNKKQIILYGPPGTGKTFIASNFIKLNIFDIHNEKQIILYNSPKEDNILVASDLKKSDITDQICGKVVSFDRKFFFYGSTLINDWKIKEFLNEPESTLDIISTMHKKETIDVIKTGDILFIYAASPRKRIVGIAEFIRPEKRAGKLTFKIKDFKMINDGPTLEDLRNDSILSKSEPIINELKGNLNPINRNAALKLLKLSKVSLEDSNVEKIVEPEIVQNNEFSKVEKIIESEILKNSELTTYEFITFHPSFSYEDFIEGLRPINNNGQISYNVEEGMFKRLCRDAFNALMTEAKIKKEIWESAEDVPQLTEEERVKARNIIEKVPYYLVIDEINRGDISRIFGELITLLESDKRLTADNELITTLPYSKKKFAVPPNLYLIGTMNTADKSIALLDIALRRRFGFIEMMPDCSVLKDMLVSEDEHIQEVFNLSILALEKVNKNILKTYDRDHQIGHSYLLKLRDSVSLNDVIENFRFIWYYEILPLMQEYFYDSPVKLKQVMENEFIVVDDRSFSFINNLEGEEFIEAIQRIAKSEKRQTESGD